MGEIVKKWLFAWIVLIAFCGEPALAAGSYTPISLTQPLKVSRGKIAPQSPDAAYFTHDESCRFLVSDQGWTENDCAAVENILAAPAPGIDSAVIYKPVSEGYIRFEDWSGSKEQIDEIWTGFVEAMKDQSQRLNKKLVPQGWLVHPTLDKNKAYMYYALIIDWEGRKSVNIKATLFDRAGYVPFVIVPEDSAVTAAQAQALLTRFLSSYTSDPDASYFDFKQGDKVAAIGALGVLATLMGVKVAKVAAVGLFAVALAFGKKLIFLLIVLPFLALRRLFRRRDRIM